jgi:pentatricopeptide repeat domain-containing protein 1
MKRLWQFDGDVRRKNETRGRFLSLLILLMLFIVSEYLLLQAAAFSMIPQVIQQSGGFVRREHFRKVPMHHNTAAAVARALQAAKSNPDFNRSQGRSDVSKDANGRRRYDVVKSSRSKLLRKSSSLDWYIRQLDRFQDPIEVEAWMTTHQQQQPNATLSWKVRDQIGLIKYLSSRQAPLSILRHVENLDSHFDLSPDALVKIYTTGLFSIATSSSSLSSTNTAKIAWSIMDLMDKHNVAPTTLTFAAVLQNIRSNGPLAVMDTMRTFEKRYPAIAWDETVYQAAISACRSTHTNDQNENGKTWQTALQLMQQMQRRHRIQPSSQTYLAVLEVLADTGKIPMIRSIIRQWINSKQNEKDIDKYQERIWATAINTCARVGDFRQATEFIQEIKAPNLRHCTSLLKAFANADQGHLAAEALQLMARGEEERSSAMAVPGCPKPLFLPAIHPDLVAINTVISAATRVGNYEAAQALFDRLRNGEFLDPEADNTNDQFSEKVLSPDRITYHSLLAGCNDPERAKQIIKEMRLSRRYRYHATPPTSVSYARAIQACQRSPSPDLETVNILLEWAKDDKVVPSEFMYGPAIWTAQRNGNFQRCMELYEEMKELGCRVNDVAMNGLLAALCDNQKEQEALQLFDQMKDLEYHASVISLKRLVAMIDSSVSMSTRAKELTLLHIFNRMDEIERRIDTGSPVFESLIAFYGSMGDVEKAMKIADRIIGYMDAPCLRAILLAHASCSEPRWKEAVEILHTSDIVEGASGPGLIDQLALSHVLVACSKANEFEEGLSLLQLYGIPASKLPPGAPSMTAASINALIAACGRGGCPEISLAILNEMYPRFGIRPDSRSYRSAVIACNQAQHGKKIYGRDFSDDDDGNKGGPYFEWWEISLALLDRMIDEELIPDVQTFSSVISACEAAGQWQRALGILQMIIEDAEPRYGDAETVHLNLYCWNAAISACEKGGAWVEALDLYERMLENDSIAPNFITMNSLIEALSNNGQKDLAQSKYDEGVEMGIVDPWRRTRNNKGETILALDLHKFSAAMAKAALRNTLDTWLDENHNSGVLVEDLVIITGKGLNSAAVPVLQNAAKEVLLEYGIQGEIDSANTGRIVVDIDNLLECFGNRSW